MTIKNEIAMLNIKENNVKKAINTPQKNAITEAIIIILILYSKTAFVDIPKMLWLFIAIFLSESL